jgi:hypothetical protein
MICCRYESSAAERQGGPFPPLSPRRMQGFITGNRCLALKLFVPCAV